MLIVGWIQINEIHFGELPQEVTRILTLHLNFPSRFKPYRTFNFNLLRDSVQGVSTFTTPTTFVKPLEDSRRICVNTRLYQEWPETVWFKVSRNILLNILQHSINPPPIFGSIKLSLLGRIHISHKTNFIWTPIHFIHMMNNIIYIQFFRVTQQHS